MLRELGDMVEVGRNRCTPNNITVDHGGASLLWLVHSAREVRALLGISTQPICAHLRHLRINPSAPSVTSVENRHGGGGGIRTHGGLLDHNRFQDGLLKPLGHPSPASPIVAPCAFDALLLLPLAAPLIPLPSPASPTLPASMTH